MKKRASSVESHNPSYTDVGLKEQELVIHTITKEMMSHWNIIQQKRKELLDVLSQKSSNAVRNVHVDVRWMIRRDMPEVLEIEQMSFENPWIEDHFIQSLRQRGTIGIVAEGNEKLLGFAIYELHKTYLHLLNIAVHPNMWRRNVGSQMVQSMQMKLSQQRRGRIGVEVMETNLAAQHFFRANGFKATDVLHGHYEDSPEDAYVMEYRFAQTKRNVTEAASSKRKRKTG